MTSLAVPYSLDGRGRTALAAEDQHIRDLLAAVLFTAPGERVNRPNFGSGLQQLVFAPNSAELAAATQFLVQGAIQQWLGDLIVVNEVEVRSDDDALRVHVAWTVRQTQEQFSADFTQ